ncbi:winged helix-turn-helix transcriptional regulator [Pseudonocardia sp. CA-107938]|uniref:winged helix-turn-helix transcriptional regulator n=1 Tax=Pseudonocardia sp. CA-107938 TaxID=3240021 RepID=UPI003D91E95C
MRGSTTGRPIMAALDLLGRRWTLRLLWELQDGPLGARAILARCTGLSSSVLYRRLRELEAAGIVAKDADDAYGLTAIGGEIGETIAPLNSWSKRWVQAVPGAVESVDASG